MEDQIMLPDFPELKRKLGQLVRGRLQRSFYREAPVIAEMRRFRSHEGDTFTINRLGGTVATSTYREISAEMTVDKKDLSKLGPHQLVAKIDGMARTMAEKAETNMFERLRQETSEVGNVIDAEAVARNYRRFFGLTVSVSGRSLRSV